MKRVLVTGPTGRIEEYARAASRAGWDAVEHPLLAIEPRAFERAEIDEARFDWICVTSSSAIPYLETLLEEFPDLRGTPCAVVGGRTAARLREARLDVGIGPASDGRALAKALQPRSRGGARVLWPRGSGSDELGRELRKAGFTVCEPIAYASRTVEAETPDAPPPAEAVFFASPSAVRAWHAIDGVGERRIAIAIGATTFHALLEETEPLFFDTISLPQPTPEALGLVLAHLELENSP